MCCRRQWCHSWGGYRQQTLAGFVSLTVPFQTCMSLRCLINLRRNTAGAPLRAVVIGAGLAGLTAAHCLADGLFDEVTLLERDRVSTDQVDTSDPNLSKRTPFHRRSCHCNMPRASCEHLRCTASAVSTSAAHGSPVQSSTPTLCLRRGSAAAMHVIMHAPMHPVADCPQVCLEGLQQAVLVCMQLLGRLRPGVPQFPQPHVLLKRGLLELDALFGDLEAKLVAAGAVPTNWLENTVTVRSGWGVGFKAVVLCGAQRFVCRRKNGPPHLLALVAWRPAGSWRPEDVGVGR